MDLPIEARRLKELRQELGHTQSEFAQLLDCGSTTADIERGRTKLSGTVVMRLLRDYNINPLWIFGESQQRTLNPDRKDVSPRTISVDAIGEENIVLVNEKAAAGYAGNLGDPEYYQSLPAFTFPLAEYRNATFRGFEVEGHSMYPALLSGEWVIAQAIHNIADIKNGNIYVIVEEEGIRVKKVIKRAENQELLLQSINPDYPSDVITFDQVKELWEFHSKLTKDLSIETQQKKLDDIHKEVLAVKQLIKR